MKWNKRETIAYSGLPGGATVKYLSVIAVDTEMQVQSLGWEDPIEGGHGNPLQYSCPMNPMDRGAWCTTVHRVKRSQTQLRQLIKYTHKRGLFRGELSSRNCPWVNTDIGLIRQILKISDLKYTQRAKENHVKIAKEDIEQYINRKYQETEITKSKQIEIMRPKVQ